MADAAAFRVLRADDVRQLFRDSQDWRQSLRHLSSAGLLREAHQKGLEHPYLTPTKDGARLAERLSNDQRDQGYLAGFRKDRASDLRHDAAVYRASLREIKKAEEAGGRLLGAILDDELRRRFNRDRAAQEHELARSLTEREAHELAAEHGLSHDVDGRLQLPDARLDFEARDGSRYSVGVEVVTSAYDRGTVQSKLGAGFHLYVPSGDHARGGGSFIETLDDIWR